MLGLNFGLITFPEGISNQAMNTQNSASKNGSNNRKFYIQFPYSRATEERMFCLHQLLTEKARRLYAATEALKLGYGGITYIANVLKCDRKTIYRGILELKHPDKIESTRVRTEGGGRKASIKTIPDLSEKFLKILRDYTAGDPMDGTIRWTNLTHQQIADKLKEDYGIEISRRIVKQLFKKHGYKKRKAQKSLSIGESKDRNEQFENIAELKNVYMNAGNPIISMDTKKKEFIGNLYRDGALYTLEFQDVYDHDFPHLADGIIIPHGIYDVIKNQAYVNIGTSKDTSEFACDSLRQWWYNQGISDYPNATSILILCDAGGSNSYRHYIFKEALEKLANEIRVEIRIAHYPSYASKWNPIEHKLFCHITRSLRGVILKSYDIVKELIESTITKTGLKVRANIITKVYKTGKKYAANYKEEMQIKFDEKLGKWNYRAAPIKA